MEEVEGSGNTALLEAINQIDSLTVFAPLDGAFGGGGRKLLQQEGDGTPPTDDWGAYMVPAYLDFDDLVETRLTVATL